MQGIALYRLGALPASAAAFAQALLANPYSRNGWQNLGDVLLFQFRLKEAVWAYSEGIFTYKVLDDVSKVRRRVWRCVCVCGEWKPDYLDAVVAIVAARSRRRVVLGGWPAPSRVAKDCVLSVCRVATAVEGEDVDL